MCGICGVLNSGSQPVESERLERMTAMLQHRGPDDSGVWAHGPVGLGNTRLAVIDLSPAGRQPMSDASGRVHIVFNGEIYNFQALREQLLRTGHTFASGTDTEVILKLYLDHGTDCLHHLHGMFALAIWDAAKRSLLLARDRLGKKPLYYYRRDNRLIFASEIKSLLEYPDVPRVLNLEAVPYYLAYGYVPAPQTIFAGIRALLPGERMTVCEGALEIQTYWKPALPVTEGKAEHAPELDWGARLLSGLRAAVRARMISDVPMGAFLSGGLDSSAVVALMAEASTERVQTFSIGFADEPSYNETAQAQQVARHLGTDHREFVVDVRAAELMPKLIWHLDQPFGDSSAIPTYLVAKLAREYVTVALTGDGGDELLAGYDRFRAARLSEYYNKVPHAVHAALAFAGSRLPQGTGYRNFARRFNRFVGNARKPLPERYLGWVGVMTPDAVGALVADTSGPDLAAHFGTYFRMAANGDPLPALLDVNMRTYLPDDLLVKTDRMTMAASVEARSPFLDHQLVEIVAGMPPALKMRGKIGKYLLRQVFRDKLPAATLTQPKHGFGVPVGNWFRGRLRDYLIDNLLSARSAQRGLLRPAPLRRLVDEHLTGVRDHGHALWTLLALEIWHQVFLDG
ncbi:MAG: asparagine synthase (glutamine-hydrolyzing) [Anaerolineales bacterium]